MPVYQIVEVWLATEFVYPLGNFVARRVSQARKEGNEFGGDGGSGSFLEDDVVERTDGDLVNLNGIIHERPSVRQLIVESYCALVAHQPLGDSVNRMEDDEFGDT